MNNSEVRNAVSRINVAGRALPWIDFELKKLSDGRLEVHGGIDLLGHSDLVIVFSEVFLVSAPLGWKTETNNDFFFMLDGPEAKKINQLYQVEEGNYLFRFKPEYYPEAFGCYIAARSIELLTGLQTSTTLNSQG